MIGIIHITTIERSIKPNDFCYHPFYGFHIANVQNQDGLSKPIKISLADFNEPDKIVLEPEKLPDNIINGLLTGRLKEGDIVRYGEMGGFILDMMSGEHLNERNWYYAYKIDPNNPLEGEPQLKNQKSKTTNMKLRKIQSTSILDTIECFEEGLPGKPCIFLILSDGSFKQMNNTWLRKEHITLALGIMNDFSIYFNSLK